MLTYFDNQLRGYNVVLAALRAFSQDICRICIGLSGSQTKVKKGLKKLRMDLEASTLSESDKRRILAQIEHCVELAEALDELPEEQKQVFVMHELEGKSFKEIAEITGEPQNTLLSRKRYAVLYLREQLKELYDEFEM